MAIPDNYNFSLEDVCDEIGLIGLNRNLPNCFTSAKSAGFNPSYSGSKNSLKNFRGYNHSVGVATTPVSVGSNVSSATSACSAPTALYYIPSGQSFAFATALYTNATGTTNASPRWYSDGSNARYWDGTSFTSNIICAI